jgi:hypothetical protein
MESKLFLPINALRQPEFDADYVWYITLSESLVNVVSETADDELPELLPPAS